MALTKEDLIDIGGLLDERERRASERFDKLLAAVNGIREDCRIYAQTLRAHGEALRGDDLRLQRLEDRVKELELKTNPQ